MHYVLLNNRTIAPLNEDAIKMVENWKFFRQSGAFSKYSNISCSAAHNSAYRPSAYTPPLASPATPIFLCLVSAVYWNIHTM